jgi:hypothetical protein
VRSWLFSSKVPLLLSLAHYRDRFEVKVMHALPQDQERGGKLRIGRNRILCPIGRTSAVSTSSGTLMDNTVSMAPMCKRISG